MSQRDDQRRKIASAFVMNPTISFSVVDCPYFRSAFDSSLATIIRRTLSALIVDVDKDVNAEVSNLISGSPVSVIFDGGKDVNGRKLIGSGVIWEGSCLYLEIRDTHLETLTAEYYELYCSSLFQKLETNKCVILAVTIDNEASENAGLRRCIEKTHSHVVHIR